MARKIHEARKSYGGKSNCRRRPETKRFIWWPSIDFLEELINREKYALSVHYGLKGTFKRRRTEHDTRSGNSLRRRGNFPFMCLPRELRDHIYTYVIGVRPKTIYESVITQARYHAYAQEDLPEWPFVSLLLANRQIHNEALQILYTNKVFVVHLDVETPLFNPRMSTTDPNPKYAVPFGWNLQFITHLVLHIDLSWKWTTYDTMKVLDFKGLKDMTALRKIQVAITMWRIRSSWRKSPVQHPHDSRLSATMWIDENGSSPNGTEVFRVMIANLISFMPVSVREVLFGAGTVGKLPTIDTGENFHVDSELLKRIVDGSEEFQEWKKNVEMEGRRVKNELKVRFS